MLELKTKLLAPQKTQAVLQVRSPTEPARRWVGSFTTLKGSRTRLEATIQLFAGVLEGKGFAEAFPRHIQKPGSDFALEGSHGFGEVDFSMWINQADFFHNPMRFHGSLDASQTRMLGSWQVVCLYPETCSCQGTKGTFQLQRIKDADIA